MAEAALARREARRRKILENSHNRLQLISGKNVDDVVKESAISAPIYHKICENEAVKNSTTSITNPIINGVFNSELSFEFLQTNSEDVVQDEEVTNDLTSLVSSTPDTVIQTVPLLEKLANGKYDIVLISLLLQLLYSCSVLRFDSSYFFLPLILYIITKLFLYPNQNNFAFANALLLLNGMTASRVQRIIFILQWVSTLSQDVCVFLFTTVCVQALCLFMKGTVI